MYLNLNNGTYKYFMTIVNLCGRQLNLYHANYILTGKIKYYYGNIKPISDTYRGDFRGVSGGFQGVATQPPLDI